MGRLGDVTQARRLGACKNGALEINKASPFGGSGPASPRDDAFAAALAKTQEVPARKKLVKFPFRPVPGNFECVLTFHDSLHFDNVSLVHYLHLDIFVSRNKTLVNQVMATWKPTVLACPAPAQREGPLVTLSQRNQLGNTGFRITQPLLKGPGDNGSRELASRETSPASNEGKS
ncbi:hypothetical protein PCASD_23858 [Puccinia coronata f. sp. avenae]|uniref:Uncharacterized protein n=1 Tax=Puccinia coronata f. sp. avenae TaxID=200324 RepID=A0A2N5S0Q8_9BASI|nr:hypothetical protein PCASD_23858 [Puccinia coronata f. sp. avenae]